MRSLQLLWVLVTTCLPAAFAQLINNTGTAKVITESGADISGQYTIQNAKNWYLAFSRTGPPGHTVVGIGFQKEYAIVDIKFHRLYGQSGHKTGLFEGVSISGAGKCAATQYRGGRNAVVAAYACGFDDAEHHVAAKLMFSLFTCGTTKNALSLAQRISGAGKKEDFKFTKANPKSAPSQRMRGKSGTHVNPHHHPHRQLSRPGRHHGGYKGQRHGRRTRNGGHDRRHEGRDHHGGHGGHGHKGSNHHGGGHPRHHQGRSVCPGKSRACQRRRHHLAKRDSQGPMSVSPQGPVSSSGAPATGSGTPKQSASGASGRAGTAAGDHGAGLQQSKVKTTQDQGSEDSDTDPDSEEGKSNAEIAEDLSRGLISGKPQKVCLVGQDHLGDMKTTGVTGEPMAAFNGAPGLTYDFFNATLAKFWFTLTKVN